MPRERFSGRPVLADDTFSFITWLVVAYLGFYIMLNGPIYLRKKKEDFEDLPKDYVDRPLWREGERTNPVSDVVYFTYEEFGIFLDELEKEGIEEVLMNAYPNREYAVIKHYLQNYAKKKT